MKNKVPNPKKRVHIVMADVTELKLETMGTAVKRYGGTYASPSYILHYLVQRANPKEIAEELSGKRLRRVHARLRRTTEPRETAGEK